MSASADDSAPTDPCIRELRAIPSRRVGRQHGARCFQGATARVSMPLDQVSAPERMFSYSPYENFARDLRCCERDLAGYLAA